MYVANIKRMLSDLFVGYIIQRGEQMISHWNKESPHDDEGSPSNVSQGSAMNDHTCGVDICIAFALNDIRSLTQS